MSYSGVVQNVSMLVRAVRTVLFMLSITVILSGCQALRPPAELKYASSTSVESLSSNVSLKYMTHDRSISGNGYLMYRKPDQMRVVILSPFGSVLQEVYVSGELVTIIDSGNGIAFRGTYLDLPDKGDFSGWRYCHWLIDIDPPDSSRINANIERINRFGQPENASFENGLLISKTTAVGGNVKYSRYTTVQGVAFPLEIKYETAANEKFSILLEDPEINVSFVDGAFTPNLSKLRVYPLSALK
jgi:outer membrane lipoprotein-sorting protein